MNAFLGLPRQGILNMLKTREGKIEIVFRVEGDLSDPHFKLQQSFASAMASGLAEQLGVSVKGAASGVVTLGRKGAEGVGDVAKQVGRGVKRLFEGGR